MQDRISPIKHLYLGSRGRERSGFTQWDIWDGMSKETHFVDFSEVQTLLEMQLASAHILGYFNEAMQNYQVHHPNRGDVRRLKAEVTWLSLSMIK